MHKLFHALFIIIMCSIQSAHSMELQLPTKRNPSCTLLSKTSSKLFKAQERERIMFMCTYANEIEMMETLLKKGVNANQKNILGITLLHIASDNNSPQAMQLLIDHGAQIAPPKPQIHPIFEAVYKGEEKVVACWLHAGINPNRSLTNNVAPLYIAASEGHIDIVKMLLKAGAYPDWSTYNGWNSLHAVACSGDTAIAQLLVQTKKIDVDHVTQNNETALCIASQYGHIDIVRTLIAQKANINLANSFGFSPLLVAIDNDLHDIAMLLINAGADVNQKTVRTKWTPLCLAALRGMSEVVALLLAKDAHIHHKLKVDSSNNTLIKKGDTALAIARKKKHAEIVALIEKYMEAQNTGSKKSHRTTTTSTKF